MSQDQEPPRATKTGKTGVRERVIDVRAETGTIQGWRKWAVVGQADTSSFALVSDEGPYLPGGEGTAATPLAYFTAGLAL